MSLIVNSFSRPLLAGVALPRRLTALNYELGSRPISTCVLGLQDFLLVRIRGHDCERIEAGRREVSTLLNWAGSQ